MTKGQLPGYIIAHIRGPTAPKTKTTGRNSKNVEEGTRESRVTTGSNPGNCRHPAGSSYSRRMKTPGPR